MTSVLPDGPHLTVQGTGGFVQDVLAALTGRRVRVAEMSVTSPGLEDVFLNLTGRAMRTQEVS